MYFILTHFAYAILNSRSGETKVDSLLAMKELFSYYIYIYIYIYVCVCVCVFLMVSLALIPNCNNLKLFDFFPRNIIVYH